MNQTGKKALLGAAVAGIMGVALASPPASAKDRKRTGDVMCWGVNQCGGHAHGCMGKGSCAGKNGCKGQGWLAMPQDSCENIEGGSPAPSRKAEKADAPPRPMRNFGSQ